MRVWTPTTKKVRQAKTIERATSVKEREIVYVRESAFNRRGAEWRKWKSISVL